MPKISEKITFHLPTGANMLRWATIAPYPSPGTTPDLKSHISKRICIRAIQYFVAVNKAKFMYYSLCIIFNAACFVAKVDGMASS